MTKRSVSDDYYNDDYAEEESAIDFVPNPINDFEKDSRKVKIAFDFGEGKPCIVNLDFGRRFGGFIHLKAESGAKVGVAIKPQ